MSLHIPAHDHGRIYVFDVSDQTAEALDAAPDTALAQTFGVLLDSTFVDVVDTDDLGDMRLSDYIQTGYEIPADRLDRDAVNDITGTAVLIMSRAFGGAEVHLNLGASPRHVTTCSDPMALHPTTPLISEAAEGNLSAAPERKPVSDAAMSGRVAMVALAVMFALVGLMIWVAS